MSEKGYIKLDRKLLEWGWWQDEKMVKFWVWLILTANHSDKYENGVLVKRGQKLIGRKKAAKELNFTEQSLRTMISRLKSTNEITTKSTNKYTIITILKYDDYQNYKKKSTTKSTNKLTNEQPTTNQQLTTNNTLNTLNTLNNTYKYKDKTKLNKIDKLPIYDTSKNKEITNDDEKELLKLMGKA